MPELAEHQTIAATVVTTASRESSRPASDVRFTTSRQYVWQLFRVGIPLAVGDASAVAVSLVLVAFLNGTLLDGSLLSMAGTVLGMVAVHTLGFWSAGLYPGAGLHPARELRQLFRTSCAVTLAMGVGNILTAGGLTSYSLGLLAALPLQLLLLPGFRSITKALMRRFKLFIPVYFVGRRHDVIRVSRDMERFEWSMLRGVGRFSCGEATFDDAAQTLELTPEQELAFERSIAYKGNVEDLVGTALQEGVYWLIVVADEIDLDVRRWPQQVLESFPQLIRVSATPSTWCAGSSLINCGLASGVRVEETLLLPSARRTKRAIDLIFGLLAGVCLLPAIVMIALLLRLTTRGSIFYCHQRIGKHGRSFRAWKFSSMYPNADQVLEKYLTERPELRAEWLRDHKLKQDPRITWIGGFLRKTSLDELPQLWNILRGEMSLVGPRPIVNAEIEKYGDTFRTYLRVTPGLTGLWQVSGRNNTSYAERLAYDRYYVQHWSPWLDLYILLRTVKTVFLCEGAY